MASQFCACRRRTWPFSTVAPSNWQALDAADIDIGSLAPTLMADKGLVFQSGKTGLGYLLSATPGQLGGIGGALFTQQVCAGNAEAIGSTAYDAGTSTVYVPCFNGLQAVHVVGGATPSFSVSTLTANVGINEPMVAAGAVWDALDNGSLVGLDRTTGQLLASLQLQGAPTHLAALTNGGGLLLVPENTHVEAIGFGAAVGRDFSLMLPALFQVPTLSWSPGGAQVGFFIGRISNSGAVAILPAPGLPLPSGATSFIDLSAFLEQAYCYQVVALDSTGGILPTTDVVCMLPRTHSGIGAPPSFTININQSRVSLSWIPPGVQTGYQVVAIPSSGTPRVTSLPGSATSMIDDTGGLATCYIVVSTSSGPPLGNSDVLCGVPGRTSVVAATGQVRNPAARVFRSGSTAPTRGR